MEEKERKEKALEDLERVANYLKDHAEGCSYQVSQIYDIIEVLRDKK